MFCGFLIICLVGLTGALVGVIMSRMAQNGGSGIAFYTAGCWMVAFIAWLVIADWQTIIDRGLPPRFTELVFWLSFAGMFNAGGQFLLIMAMRVGHKGISWSIVQTAMVMPFVISIIVWGEDITLTGLFSLLFLICAVFLMGGVGRNKNPDNRGYSLTWFLYVIGALVLIGLTQTFQSVSSHWVDWTDELNLRVPVFSTAGAISNTIAMVVLKQRTSRLILKYASIWAVLAILYYALLFKGLDILAGVGLSRYAFPLAQAVCMIFFVIYSSIILKEHFGKSVKVGVCLSLMGILLFAL